MAICVDDRDYPTINLSGNEETILIVAGGRVVSYDSIRIEKDALRCGKIDFVLGEIRSVFSRIPLEFFVFQALVPAAAPLIPCVKAEFARIAAGIEWCQTLKV